MTKVKIPLFSFGARRRLGDDIVFTRRHGVDIVELKPEPQDAKSLSQLSWRHMFQKVVALWHALSAAEKEAWESLGRRRHMTGYAWFLSQALRPNPGIYLPLQGGTMSGDIDMATNKIEDLPDPALDQDADTKAARDAAIAAALAGSLHCDIYGFDGSNWQTLRVDSSVNKNLRVALYYGADVLDGKQMNTDTSYLKRGLIVYAGVAGFDATSVYRISRKTPGADALSVGTSALCTVGFLHGYNGASWDRLRSYPPGILKVGRAEIGLSTLRRVGAGQVKASPGTLYWMTMNPTAANSVVELTDDLNGLGAVVWDMTHGANAAHHMNLDPPMEFSTGIYLKTITNFTSIIFGYK